MGFIGLSAMAGEHNARLLIIDWFVSEQDDMQQQAYTVKYEM